MKSKITNSDQSMTSKRMQEIGVASTPDYDISRSKNNIGD
jgi:hypothetical protein